MKGYIFPLVLGLAVVICRAELTPNADASDSKNIEFKDASFGASSQSFDKTKRGAVKITNTDSPTFNHLSSPSSSATASAGVNTFKTSLAPGSVAPFRYMQTAQYHPFFASTYLQPSQTAAQIAAQYSLQTAAAPVAHYLQAPAQVQYVPSPAVAQFPFVQRYQSYSNDYTGHGASASVAGSSSSSSATSSGVSGTQSSAQYHQSLNSGSQTSRPASAAVGTNLHHQSLFQASQPLYYMQQPLLLLVQPQAAAANFLYQQPGLNYFLKQQPQQFLSLHPGNRFTMYPATHTNQFTYLVPMAVTSSVSADTSSANDLKSTATKHSGNNQHSGSSTSYAYANKV